MAKMTYVQITYANERLDKIRRGLVGKAPTQWDIPSEEAFALGIENGDIKITQAQLKETSTQFIRSANRNSYHSKDWQEFLREIVFEKQSITELAKFNAEQDIYKALSAKVTTEYTRIKDRIILGDMHEALSMLEDFARYEV